LLLLFVLLLYHCIIIIIINNYYCWQSLQLKTPYNVTYVPDIESTSK